MVFPFNIPSSLFPYVKKRIPLYKLHKGKTIALKDPGELPRKIFILWSTGIDSAPEIVKYCAASWSRLNPGWEVQVLDMGAADRICDRKEFPESLRVPHYSDLLRVKLMKTHGGIWVDATCLCMKPLDQWIDAIFCQAEFFAFTYPGKDRMISSWFLASTKGNPIVSGWFEALEAFWKKPRRKAPYFSSHYLFEAEIRRNRKSAKSWQNTPKFSAVAPHLLKRILVHNYEITPAMKQTLRAAPVQKLSHKKDFTVDQIRKIVESL